MTLRELVACASPLPDGNTVGDHLAATDCGALVTTILLNVYPSEEDIIVQEPVAINEFNEEVKILEEDVIIIADEEIDSINEIIGESIDGIC